ncbi:MucR family transcriptional regulator [Methylobacterium nigriterrae]|uniref:MucR family transcriptional regulator n=1 Tax=Methylobacterium nigriterrae TaxID=3127512 RepID=UPI0030134D3D
MVRLEQAAEIVSAYVSHNSVAMPELPAVIRNVHGALLGLATPEPVKVETFEKATPAQIRRSITPNGLISFIDGRSYKTLKRHLAAHGLYPQSYRRRYGLPDDYPMVAADYAARRSELARSIGLGRPVSAPVDARRPSGPQGRRRVA